MNLESAQSQGYEVSHGTYAGVLHTFNAKTGDSKIFDSMTGEELDQTRPRFMSGYHKMGSRQINWVPVVYIGPLVVLAVISFFLAGCASDPRSTRGAKPNTYCGNWVWGTVTADGNDVICPKE